MPTIKKLSTKLWLLPLPLVKLKRLLFSVHSRGFSESVTIDDLKNLIPPVSAVGISEIVSLEAMLSRGVLVFDFDTAWVKQKSDGLTKSGRLSGVERSLLDYESIFKDLLGDSKNACLKMKFCLVRLRLNTFLVERLLRDYLKRCKLHLNLLSELHEMNGTNGSTKVTYYMKQSDWLLKELGDFFARKVEVFGYVDSAFSCYRVDSKCDFGMYALEKDFYKLREKWEFKRLTESLVQCMSELKDCRLASLSSSPSISKAGFGLILTQPWYESESVLAMAFGVICICTVYLILKKENNDSGGRGGSTSVIDSSKGLMYLLPSRAKEKKADPWDWLVNWSMAEWFYIHVNVRLMSLCFFRGRFAAYKYIII